MGMETPKFKHQPRWWGRAIHTLTLNSKSAIQTGYVWKDLKGIIDFAFLDYFGLNNAKLMVWMAEHLYPMLSRISNVAITHFAYARSPSSKAWRRSSAHLLMKIEAALRTVYLGTELLKGSLIDDQQPSTLSEEYTEELRVTLEKWTLDTGMEFKYCGPGSINYELLTEVRETNRKEGLIILDRRCIAASLIEGALTSGDEHLSLIHI